MFFEESLSFVIKSQFFSFEFAFSLSDATRAVMAIELRN